MRIDRIDDAIERCEEHLSAAGVVDDKIKNLLAQSLLILIYSEFERKFRELVMERCSSVDDKPIREYIGSSMREIVRGLYLSDVSGTLARFGPTHKDKFNQRRDENRQADEMYTSLLKNRHIVAHGKGSNATLKEVKGYYEEGHVVLDYFKDALWIEDDDGARDSH